MPSITLQARNPKTPERLLESLPGTVVCLDQFEQAGPQLLELVRDRISAREPLVLTVDPSNQDSPLGTALSELDLDSDSGNALLDSFHRIELRPLTPFEILRLIHTRSDFIVDSTVAAAIVELAKGRPRWAIDLLALARDGSLITFPRPNIPREQPLERSSAVLGSVARSIGTIPPDAAAAAVILAAADPMDLPGIEDLVGAEFTAVLIRRGVLMQHQDRALFFVPRLLAAALARTASPPHIDRFEFALQRRLLTKAALGFPLSESESLLCSRAFRDSGHDAHPLPREQRSALVQHSIARLAAFGEDGLARSLLLRVDGGQGAGEGLAHAAVLSTLVGPGAGLSALERLPPAEEPIDLLARSYLRARLDELSPSVPYADPPEGAPDSSPTARDARTILRLWNTRAQEGIDTTDVRRIAATTQDPHVTLLAATLADLEDVWNGQIPESSWLTHTKELPRTSIHSIEQLQHIASAVLLAQCLAALLAGQYYRRLDEFRELAARGPLREYHARWMRHFSAAALALACGDGSRSAVEWGKLLDCAPRIIPLRLQDRLEETHEVLAKAASTESGGRVQGGALADIVYYLAGPDRMGPVQPKSDDPLREHSLPILRLRDAHLRAAAAENPVELVRLAEQLRALEEWSPAAAAFGQARDIFLRRRSVSGVQLCDERLHELEAAVAELVPWYRRGTLPTGGYTPLTPRERETAELAAAGLTNRQIAQRLHCSVRTVESHIAQARAKLGAASRRELADVASLRTD